MSGSDIEAGFGNLAQSARNNHLKSARAIFFFIGAMTICLNIFFLTQIEPAIDAEIKTETQKLASQGLMIDPVELQTIRGQLISTNYLITGGAIALGAVFLVFGSIIYQYPVPVTVTGLVLYVGSIAVFGFIDPTTIAKGFILRIIFIGLLFKAVLASIASNRETAAEALATSEAPSEQAWDTRAAEG